MKTEKKTAAKFQTLTTDEWVAKEVASIHLGAAKVMKTHRSRIAFLKRIGLLDKNGEPTYSAED